MGLLYSLANPADSQLCGNAGMQAMHQRTGEGSRKLQLTNWTTAEAEKAAGLPWPAGDQGLATVPVSEIQ